jgi:hypothetical protein
MLNREKQSTVMYQSCYKGRLHHQPCSASVALLMLLYVDDTLAVAHCCCCCRRQGELDMMKQYKEGKEVVLSKVPYWML